MELLLYKLYDFIKKDVPFYTNTKYFNLFSRILLIQNKKYETLLANGKKIIPFKKRKKIIKPSSERVPIYHNLYLLHHDQKINYWGKITKALYQINPNTNVNELTTKYIKAKATVTLDKILELLKIRKFIFSNETIVKYYIYLCKKEIISLHGEKNIYDVSITQEDKHVLNEMKFQLERNDKFNNKKNIVTQYFLSSIKPGLAQQDNHFIRKFHKESMLKSIFNSLNRVKSKKKRDENNTMQQESKHHKYITSLLSSNVKVIKSPEINKTDERLISKESISCMTEKKENNSSGKTRKFTTLLHNYSNCSYKLGCSSRLSSSRKKYDFSQTSSKKSTANNSFVIIKDALKSKIQKTKLPKKKLIIMPHHNIISSNLTNILVRSPISISECKTKRHNSGRVLSCNSYQSQKKPRVLKLCRQKSAIDYLSKNDFYYS